MKNQLKTYHKNLLILILLCCTAAVKAQRADSITYSPDQTYYWAGFHLGGGSYAATAGADAGVLLYNKLVIAAKAATSGNLVFFGPRPETIQADEYALLVGGKLTHYKYCNFILLSGISAIRLEDRGDVVGYQYTGLSVYDVYGDNKIYKGVGIPVMLKFTVAPGWPVAFDFAASSNFNAKRAFFSLSFGVCLGKLRNSVKANPPSPAQKIRQEYGWVPIPKKFGN